VNTPPAGAILPFIVCAVCGAGLATLELIRTFGKWIGRYWLNRYAFALIALNVAASLAVFAFLRYGLEVESTLIVAVVTGLTFPAILRTRFTFYRPVGKAESGLNVEEL